MTHDGPWVLGPVHRGAAFGRTDAATSGSETTSHNTSRGIARLCCEAQK